MQHTFPDHARRLQALHLIRRELGSALLSRDTPTSWLQQDGVVPCGICALEWTLGMSGLPRGCIVELLGPEHAGKSTLALAAVAGAQSAGAIVAWVDTAQQFDAGYAFAFGIHGEELLISRPRSAEQALGIVSMLVRSGVVDLVVLDSLSAMIPQSDISPTPSPEPSGSTSLVLLRSLRRMYPLVRRSPCCLLFLDQLADRGYIGAGSVETTACTRILTPFSAVRIVLNRVQKPNPALWEQHPVARLTALKNRFGPIGRGTEITWNVKNGRISENTGRRMEPSSIYAPAIDAF